MIHAAGNGTARKNAEDILRQVRTDVAIGRAAATDAEAPGVTRIAAHCHSKASDGPAIAALGLINCPECYSAPEAVYDQAMARGMDLVTITDHNTIAGAMVLVERGFERFIVGQEVSVRFPEDRCMLHVLVWGLTPELDEQITELGLRDEDYQFAAWLREHALAKALAHPLYIQNAAIPRSCPIAARPSPTQPSSSASRCAGGAGQAASAATPRCSRISSRPSGRTTTPTSSSRSARRRAVT